MGWRRVWAWAFAEKAGAVLWPARLPRRDARETSRAPSLPAFCSSSSCASSVCYSTDVLFLRVFLGLLFFLDGQPAGRGACFPCSAMGARRLLSLSPAYVLYVQYMHMCIVSCASHVSYQRFYLLACKRTASRASIFVCIVLLTVPPTLAWIHWLSAQISWLRHGPSPLSS